MFVDEICLSIESSPCPGTWRTALCRCLPPWRQYCSLRCVKCAKFFKRYNHVTSSKMTLSHLVSGKSYQEKVKVTWHMSFHRIPQCNLLGSTFCHLGHVKVIVPTEPNMLAKLSPYSSLVLWSELSPNLNHEINIIIIIMTCGASHQCGDYKKKKPDL